jgi:hypothetical protein
MRLAIFWCNAHVQHTKDTAASWRSTDDRGYLFQLMGGILTYSFLLGLATLQHAALPPQSRRLFLEVPIANHPVQHFWKGIKEHESEVLAMGYDSIDELACVTSEGVHHPMLASTRRPYSSYVVLAYWLVHEEGKDIYFHQTQEEGDKFVGRCATLLIVVICFFACIKVGRIWRLTRLLKEVVPSAFQKLGLWSHSATVLSSLIHHRDKVGFLIPITQRNDINIPWDFGESTTYTCQCCSILKPATYWDFPIRCLLTHQVFGNKAK